MSARQTNVAVGGVVCCAVLTMITIAWCVRISPRTHIGLASATPAPSTERLRQGERLYREGLLPSGALLRGHHQGGGDVAGAMAACAQCHRRSGMGSFEGNRVIPPVAGRFLFQPRAQTAADLDGHHARGPDFAHAAGRDRPRPPYTRELFLRALRDGIDAAGRPLDLLMPRFVLDDADADVLADYLTQLSDRWSPGVTADSLHFATVIAPGVDPRRRQAMLDVLGAYFSVHNASTRLGALRDRAYADSPQAAHRTWQLDVWDLAGPPETWLAQLDDFAGREPPFALVSGLGEGEWAPVHGFCETRGIPCWFPTVDLPVTAADDFYTVYFTGGVTLEAQLLSHELRARRVVQIRGRDPAAAGATQALGKALGAAGVRVDTRALPLADAAALRDAIADAGPGDAVVLWLRPAEVARLHDVAPPPGAALYFSATLAGTELPEAWRAEAHLVDPFELPELRRANVARFHAWLQMRGMPVVDERVQSDAYLACTLLAEKIDETLETLTREHLLERAEALLGARPGIYHRLSLGPSQRVASKGGYITRFRPDGVLVADTGWLVP